MQKKKKSRSRGSNNNQNNNYPRDYGESSNANMSSRYENSSNNPFETKHPTENNSNYNNFNQFDAESGHNWRNQNNGNQRNYNQRSRRGYNDRRSANERSFENSYSDNYNEPQVGNNQSRRRSKYPYWRRNNRTRKEDIPNSLENNFERDGITMNDEKLQVESENINDKNTKLNCIESSNAEHPISTPKKTSIENSENKTPKETSTENSENKTPKKTSTENSENKTPKKIFSENKVIKSDLEKNSDKINLPLPLSKLKKEPKSSSEEESSSDSLDSSESSDDEDSKKTSKVVGSKIDNKKAVKKENLDKKEDEIVCLGELKRFENLADENDSNSNTQNFCILCEKQGHVSFQCFMECKNCSEKYHNLKMCQKPANLSIMLQNFMEFCWMQCYQYDPEHKFEFLRDNLPIELIPGLNQSNQFVDKSSISGSKKSNKKKRKRKHIDNKKDDSDSTTDSSSESSSDAAPKKKKKRKVDKTPYQMPPFFPMGTPHFNPLAAAAMMGFNPANYMGKKE